MVLKIFQCLVSKGGLSDYSNIICYTRSNFKSNIYNINTIVFDILGIETVWYSYVVLVGDIHTTDSVVCITDITTNTLLYRFIIKIGEKDENRR